MPSDAPGSVQDPIVVEPRRLATGRSVEAGLDALDTATAALVLASDEARFVTGAELVVAGGMSVRCD